MVRAGQDDSGRYGAGPAEAMRAGGRGGVLVEALRDLRRLLIGADYPRVGPVSPRWARLRRFAVPIMLFALVGFTAAAAAYLADNRGLEGTNVMIALAGTVPAALAAFRPLWAWRLGSVAAFLGVYHAQPTESWPWSPVQIFAFLLVLWFVAVRADAGVAAWATLLSLIPVWWFVDNSGNAWGVTVLFGAILLVGDQVRRRQRRALISFRGQVTDYAGR